MANDGGTQIVLKEIDTRMKTALDALGRELAAIRTGRASATLLDAVRVDYYGTPTPVPQNGGAGPKVAWNAAGSLRIAAGVLMHRL